MRRLPLAADGGGLSAAWRRTGRGAILAPLLVLLFAVPAVGRPKTDVVVLHNGDRVT